MLCVSERCIARAGVLRCIAYQRRRHAWFGLAKPVPCPALHNYASHNSAEASHCYALHHSAEASPGFATPRNRLPCFSSPGYARAELGQAMPPHSVADHVARTPKGSLPEGAARPENCPVDSF